MDVQLYIPKLEDVQEICARAKVEAMQNKCELDPMAFHDPNYMAYLTKVIFGDKNGSPMWMLEYVEFFAQLLYLSADTHVLVDDYFDDMGRLLSSTTGTFPKQEMHFFNEYILPYLCGFRDFNNVFWTESSAAVAALQGRAYERVIQYKPICLLHFPSAEEVIRRTRIAAKYSENDERYSMTIQESAQLDHILVPLANTKGTAAGWVGKIRQELQVYDQRTGVFLLHWLTVYGLPYVFGIPQIMRKGHEIAALLPISTGDFV